MPLVSVIIPTFQRAKVIGETLRSALSQTHRDLEVLVEDDGSTDGTEGVVRDLADPRVSYAWAPNVGRPATVRNRAIRRARGELVAFLDSDDVWHEDKLARQLAALAGDPGLQAVSCNAEYLPARPERYLALAADVRPSFDELVVENVITNSGTLARREALEAVGLFDEDPALKVEDYELWLRLLRRRDRSILVLAEPLFRYRVSTDAFSRCDPRLAFERRRIALAKHADFRPAPIAAQLAREEASVRRGELQTALRVGTLSLSAWLGAPEVPLRRRLRLAAKALLLGRARV